MAWKKQEDINPIEQKIQQSLSTPKKINIDATKDLKLVNFSFPIIYKNLLTDHFKEHGKSFSTGVREALIQYMKNNNLL